jgi:hypothetical protein
MKAPGNGADLPGSALSWRLGEGPEAGGATGVVDALDALARSGLPVYEGVVLGREAHAEFLRASGVLRAMASPRLSPGDATDVRAVARSHGSALLGERLRGTIVEALIGLGARTVTVLSEEEILGGLSTVPEVSEAVRSAWLSPTGLAWQMTALSRDEEIPTWPVLIQREHHAEYTGWSTAGAGDPAALYDVRPVRSRAPERRGMRELTLEAGSVLRDPARLLWGLEGGRWQILVVRATVP